MENKPTYRIYLICPKCQKESETVGFMVPPPNVNCGDCLIERVEVVKMKIIAAEQL